MAAVGSLCGALLADAGLAQGLHSLRVEGAQIAPALADALLRQLPSLQQLHLELGLLPRHAPCTPWPSVTSLALRDVLVPCGRHPRPGDKSSCVLAWLLPALVSLRVRAVAAASLTGDLRRHPALQVCAAPLQCCQATCMWQLKACNAVGTPVAGLRLHRVTRALFVLASTQELELDSLLLPAMQHGWRAMHG